MALVRAVSERAGSNGRESVPFGARSRPFVHAASVDELRAAIAAVTRALATARGYDEALELVRERAALRREVDMLARAPRESA
jgi:hypothetical protein